MSERDDRYAANDGSLLPRSTGEFRAAPDVSASTAEFKAFAAGQTRGTRQSDDSGSWPEQPWDDQVTGGGYGRTIWLGVVGVVVLVLLVVLVLIFFVG
jgi:hypothetical protein